MTHDDFAFDAVPGLPEAPPPGEEILWQGRPNTWALAKEALAIQWVAGYFAILALWRFLASLADFSLGVAAATALPLIGLGALACGILYAIAFSQARAALYTITTHRVAMKTGAALQVTFNLPFSQVGAVSLAPGARGTGTVALSTTGEDRISYMVAWPHVRPWHINRTQPALRAIPDAEGVAEMLAEAVETRLATPRIARKDAGPALPAVAAE